MTLKKLILHNYMIHRDLEADFDGNLIALTGEMGHGKSTFVGAIQFCLTGEHPPWHKVDLLSWGATEGSAKLYFSQDGIDCSIIRKIQKTADAVLKIGDETITGTRNVEKAMADRLGVDKDILNQIGFVQQYEIQSILFDDPGKRERSFQKLLGIGDANKIWTELGPVIQSYSKSENFDASIESLKQMINRLNTELGGINESLEVARKALRLMPSHEEQSKEIERLTKIQTMLSPLSGVRSKLKSLNAEYQQKMTELSKQKISLENINTVLGSLNDLEEFVDKLKTEHAKALAEFNSLRKLSGASEKDGMCPLCGSTVEPGLINKHVSDELKRLESTVIKYQEDFEKNNKYLIEIRRQIKEAERAVEATSARLTQISSSISFYKDSEKNILFNAGSLGISPGADVEKIAIDISTDLQRVRADMNQYLSLERQIAALQGETNAKKQQLDQAYEMLKAKEKEKELSGPIAKKVEVLTNVRNWFHSSNGPRTMSMSAIKAMTGYVNEYLRELHSEIEVIPDNQGLSFAFSYLDGRPISNPPPSTAKLSGGQKIELALAFRLAIYRYFGQKMGIMVLDEPTAHLSPAGIEYFGTLLQTVSALAKNMNLQIIMPTHEKEIMPFMDSEIHFE